MHDVIWPSAVVVIAILFMVLFRRSIHSLILHLRTVKFGEHKAIEFGDATVDQHVDNPLANQRMPEQVGSKVVWANSGNLFWIGHDLMWTMQTALRGGPPELILHGLTQSEYHARMLNMSDSAAGIDLLNLLEQARTTRDWSRGTRDRVATALTRILNEIGSLAEANQPGFAPDEAGRGTTAAQRLAASNLN